jgi:ABC-type lipoprotein export system ATPase subunit
LAAVPLLFEKLHAEGNAIIVVTHEPDIAARALNASFPSATASSTKDERIK